MSLSYLQADRPMRVTTPLGPDVLLLTGYTGEEGISRLFRFQLDLAAEDPGRVEFDKLLGQAINITVAIPEGGVRHFGGICASLSQGMPRHDLTIYRMEVVPNFWFLTRRAQSRIYQNASVPEILRQVLVIPDVTYELEGTYHPRDFCVQYRETDFQFASRLMEEEGIYYYFRHDSRGHHMVVSDRAAFPELRPALLILQPIQGKHVEEERVTSWEKRQQLRSGQVTLRDHTFELPHKHLEAVAGIQESVQVGQETHKLKIGRSERLELYDWPGAYAGRFEGIDDSGADRPGELDQIYEDKERTVAIRMQQEASESIVIHGESRYRHISSGYAFLLSEEHEIPYSGKSGRDGWYVLTSIRHTGRMPEAYRSGQDDAPLYENAFTCIPVGLPFRPRRVTPKPTISGPQSAVVVGPAGEEIHTDKYGRVKVQFHWDRQGKNDADSSCWVRVGTPWAGRNWGIIHIPRIGQEVVIAFEEGDPDRPIIVGGVYNADMMPPYDLPAHKTQSGVKSRSTPDGGRTQANELRFEDATGREQVFLNAERDLDLRVEHDAREFVGHDCHLIVTANQIERVDGDKHGHVQGNHLEKTGGDLSLQVGGKKSEKVGTVYASEAGQEIHLKAGTKIIIEAGTQISLVASGSFVDIGPAGVTIKGAKVDINSAGTAGSGSGSSPEAPHDPDVADDGSKTGKLH